MNLHEAFTNWHRIVAVVIALVGLVITTTVVIKLVNPPEPERVLDSTTVSRTYDLMTEESTIPLVVEETERAIYKQIAEYSNPNIPKPTNSQRLSKGVCAELAVYLSGSLQSLTDHIKSTPALSPLPKRLSENPELLDEVWEMTKKTLLLAPLNTTDIVVRPRIYNGNILDYSEASQVNASRPGRIVGLPDNPEESGEDVWEIVLPMEIYGVRVPDLNDPVTFPGRVGFWMIKAPESNDWYLYKFTFYDAPKGIAVLPPPM